MWMPMRFTLLLSSSADRSCGINPLPSAAVRKNNLTEVTFETLVQAGFVSSNDKVKILGNGTITRALAVKANAFSKSAEAAIVAAGGSVEKL